MPSQPHGGRATVESSIRRSAATTPSGVPRLSRSREDYLKAMFALDDGARPVTMGKLARRLGVRAPSVTNMLGTLAREQLVAYVPRSGARLTAAGRRQALALVRRHRILETFLVRVLGFDWS